MRYVQPPVAFQGRTASLRRPSGVVLQVQAHESVGRLDTYLAQRTLSRGQAQRLLATGSVRVNGEVVTKASRRLRSGDKVVFRIPQPKTLAVTAESIPLNVLFEDSHLIVLNKPKGMVVHPAPGNPTGTLVNALMYHCGTSLSGVGGVRRPGIVHRLDKDTSGAIIVAKNDAAHLHLAAQIKAHTARRVYVALVHGNPPAKGVIRAPIGRHPVHRLEMAVVPDGRPAVTHFRVLETLGPYSLLEVVLETGRTHQIRVHMAFAGFPVIGDPLYGQRRTHLLLNGQALHAWQISFVHPSLDVSMTCVATLPQPFVDLLQNLRRQFGFSVNAAGGSSASTPK